MKALVFEPHMRPVVKELPDLEAMQKCVGGYIECAYPWPDANAVLVCDEDGLAHDSDWNRYICEGMAIKGAFFICASGEDDFEDLPDELIERFTREYGEPEAFIRTSRGVMSVKADRIVPVR